MWLPTVDFESTASAVSPPRHLLFVRPLSGASDSLRANTARGISTFQAFQKDRSGQENRHLDSRVRLSATLDRPSLRQPNDSREAAEPAAYSDRISRGIISYPVPKGAAMHAVRPEGFSVQLRLVCAPRHPIRRRCRTLPWRAANFQPKHRLGSMAVRPQRFEPALRSGEFRAPITRSPVRAR